MSYLLDTHVFIWAMEKNKRLSKEIVEIIADPNNIVFVSVVNIWEIIVKKRKGLKVPEDIAGGVKKNNFTILPINIDHVMEVETLEDYHKDSFDRMLIAQTKAEDITLITSDKKIWKYKIKLLKA